MTKRQTGHVIDDVKFIHGQPDGDGIVTCTCAERMRVDDWPEHLKVSDILEGVIQEVSNLSPWHATSATPMAVSRARGVEASKRATMAKRAKAGV